MSAQTLRARFSASTLDASGSEPKWNLIIPAGVFHGKTFTTLASLGGKFDFTRAWFEELVSNWRAAGAFKVPVRWTHAHARNDKPELQRELDRKAANVIDLRVTDAGLEGLASWNDSGRKDVASGEFDGWSAEVDFRHENRLTGAIGTQILTGLALTNEPFFNTMPALAADATPQSPPAAPQGSTMNEEQLKKLRAKYQLAATATAEEVLAAIDAKDAANEKLIADAKKVEQPDVAKLIAAAVAPVEARIKGLETENATLKADAAKATDAKLVADVDNAIAAGKLGDGKTGRAITDDLSAHIHATAKRDGLDAAKKLIAALPLSGPPLQPTGVDGPHGADTAKTANDKLMARAEELRKAGDPNPTITAMRELPKLALIAEGRASN